METKEFIYTKTQSIIETIPTIRASYEYIDDIDTHIIEIVPLSEFETNDLYINIEKEFYKEFTKLFFPSTLLIVSKDSINRVENPEWIITGSEYGIITQWSDKLHIAGFNIEEEEYDHSNGLAYNLTFSFSAENNYAIAA